MSLKIFMGTYYRLLIVSLCIINNVSAVFHNYLELVKNFEEKISLGKIHEKVISKPFFNEEKLYSLVKIAEEMSEYYPNDTHIVYGLGNTPSLLIATLQLLNKDFYDTYRSIAFSNGEIFTEDFIDSEEFNSTKKHFHSYLDSIGLNPFIVQNKQETIVITDIVARGSSIKGFMKVLQNYYDKELGTRESEKVLQEKFIFHLFKIAYEPSLDRNPNYIIEWAKPKTFFYNADDILIRYADTKDSKRLIPSFPYEQWKTLIPHFYSLPTNAIGLVKKIKDYLEEIS